nr:hypothetical protein [Tanacetum cinerariifolium]
MNRIEEKGKEMVERRTYNVLVTKQTKSDVTDVIHQSHQSQVQVVNDQAEGSVRQPDNVMQKTSLNEQALGMAPQNL